MPKLTPYLTPRGTKDIIDDSTLWRKVENKFAAVCQNFGYREIRTPLFEETGLFLRGIGNETDIVQKEMYTFLDKGGRSLTLKPEGTAGVVRSVIQNSPSLPAKYFYITPCYRYERPQKDRFREFHQLGIELFGIKNPAGDCEIISLCCTFLKELITSPIKLLINNIGCSKCKNNYKEILKIYYKKAYGLLCEDCQKRFYSNPFRLLDCKKCKLNPALRSLGENAPAPKDNVCKECRLHFRNVLDSLKSLEIDYSIEDSLVRGLDYYTKIVFEIVLENEISETSLCGGGRYDGLVEELGGDRIPACGFGIGMERILPLITWPNNLNFADIFIACANQTLFPLVEKLTFILRKYGISTEFELNQKSLKSQMRYANKINSKFCLVIGELEIEQKKVKIKNMTTSNEIQIEFNSNDLYEFAKNLKEMIHKE